MMDKSLQIIEKLIVFTKCGEIKWSRLENFEFKNNLLKNFFTDLGWDIKKVDSFWAQYNDGKFFLIKRTLLNEEWEYENIYHIIIQSTPVGKPMHLEMKNEAYTEIQTQLIRLAYLVEDQLSNNENFIQLFLNS